MFPTYFFEMLKLLAIIALILCLAHTQVEKLAANPPAIPAPFQSLQIQYHYAINSITVTKNAKSMPYTCKAFCAPRSFLTVVKGLLVCQYDPTFWNFSNMNSHCIPDMQGSSLFCKSPAYSFFNQKNCKLSQSIKDTYSKLNIGCCYDSSFQSDYAEMQQRNPTNDIYTNRQN